MDFRNIKILSERLEGTVYKAFINDTEVILKSNLICSSCLEYEFLIGKELNKLESPYLVETIGYELVPEIGTKCLIQEMANGITLAKFMTDHSLVEICTVIIQIIMALIELQAYGFNHNDLHSENIIVESLEDSIVLEYNYKNTSFNLKTSFHPRFIDYGTSRVDGMENLIPEGFYIGINMYSMLYGTVGSIFDPYFDFFSIVGHCIHAIPILCKSRVNELDILKRIFNQLAGQFEVVKSDLSNGRFPGRYIPPKDLENLLDITPISVDYTPVFFKCKLIDPSILIDQIKDQNRETLKEINRVRRFSKLTGIGDIIRSYHKGNLQEDQKVVLDKYRNINDKLFYPYICYLAKSHPKPFKVSKVITFFVRNLYEIINTD